MFNQIFNFKLKIMRNKRKSVYFLASAAMLMGVLLFEKPVMASSEIQKVEANYKEVNYKWTGLGLCVWPGETCRLIKK